MSTEQTAPTRESTSPPPSKKPKVKWEVEDPSEYRPTSLENIGKDVKEFRVFYKVSCQYSDAARIEDYISLYIIFRRMTLGTPW